MIPAQFEYVAAESTAHALSLLAEHGDDAKLLAGGHSLLPMMKLRLAQPEVLIDSPQKAEAEALLRDHVRDVDGRKHDIVVLGHNVAQVRAQMEAYGLPGAVTPS